MVRITLRDDENALMLTEGCVPELSRLTAVYPGSRTYRQDSAYMPSDHEQATAWILTAYAQRIARRRGYTTEQIGRMETWLIGPSDCNEGVFRTWFEDVDVSNYRIMLHKCPSPQDRLPPGTAWSQVYNQLGIRHRTGSSAHLTREAKEHLAKMLGAYRLGPPHPAETMNELNHPVIHSSGIVM